MPRYHGRAMATAIESILVPTDFSEQAEHALHYAASLGERFGATIHLVHVNTLHGYPGQAELPAFPDLTPYLERADRAARRQLDAGVDHGGLAEATVVKALLRAASAEDAIVEYARSKGVDLVIMPTHGRTGVAHALVGSVAERVVRLSPCPVLAVRKGDRDFVDPETGAVRIGTVVLAHDLSENAWRALRYVVDHLRPYRPTIHLLHAIDLEVPAIYARVGVDSILEMYPDVRRDLRGLLEERARHVVPEGLEVVSAAVEGKPHKVAAEYARSREADLLVVAAETKTTGGERVVGGTAERIFRHAPCPTLIA
jgi:nucleotide-binding universal stress UspA family protein